MTIDEARELLDDVRAGTSGAPWHRIRLALQLTGDIPSAWSCPELRTAAQVSQATVAPVAERIAA